MEELIKEIIKSYSHCSLEELKAKYLEIQKTPGYVTAKGVTLVAIKQLIDEKENLK